MEPKTKKPSHIVVFKKVQESNTNVINSLSETKLHRAQGKASVLTAEGLPGKSDTILYTSLAVATMDMSAEQVAKVEVDPNVKAIVPNQIRTIPKPVLEFEPQEATQETFLQGYLQGVIDTAQNTLKMMGGEEGQRLNETKIASHQHLNNEQSHSWCLENIGLHENYRYTGRGITVAVLDTGIDLYHSDFNGAFTEGVNAESFVYGESVQDENGHGTHCAGVVASSIIPQSGKRYCVAPDAELLIGKVLNNQGSGYDSDIIDGIYWAVDQGARVISMSLGSSRNPGDDYYTAYEQIAEVMMNQDDGALLIAAAGNESARPHYTRPVGNPAACPSFMAVAAVNRLNKIANFSCRQMDNIGEVNISAPGKAVYSSWPGGGYKSISGTSMATPHVAGVAALYLEQKPTMTPKELWHIIESRSLSLGALADYGQGLVQVP